MVEPQFPWHLLTINHVLWFGGFTVITTSNRPCHMYLRYSKFYPHIHRKPVFRRGVAFGWDVRICFVSYQHIEQNEEGDTLTHTFTWPGWENCFTSYFYFYASVNNYDGVSDSPYFWMHYWWDAPPPQPIAKLALREAYFEAPNIQPDWEPGENRATFSIEMADRGVPDKPKLTIVYGPTVDFYPDAHPEVTSCDGNTSRGVGASGETWHTLYTSPGTWGGASGASAGLGFSSSRVPYTDMWTGITRLNLLFDISSIPAGSVITAATLTVIGRTLRNEFTYPIAVNVYRCHPASNTNIVKEDYQKYHSLPYSAPITDAAFDPAGPNVFALNPSGIAYLQSLIPP